MSIKKLNRSDLKQWHEAKNSSGQNQNHVILRFIDFDFNPDEITNILGLKPLSIGKKGEIYYVGKRKIKKTWEYNHWDYEIKTINDDYIGNTINDFFNNVIQPKVSPIKEISNKSKITRLIIVQYYYNGCNPGYSFEKEQIKLLADINAEIDMDIYCLDEN